GSTGAERAIDHVDHDEGFASLLVVAADADHGIAALSCRSDTIRHDLRQRSEHGVDDAIAGKSTRRHRRREMRIEEAALRRLDVDGPVDAGIVGDLAVERASYGK